MNWEPVVSFSKQNTLFGITLLVLLYFGNGLSNDIALVDDRIDNIDDKIDIIDGRIDSIEGRIDRIEARIDGIEGKIDLLRREMYQEHTEMRASIVGLSERLGRVETAIAIPGC